MNSQYQLIVCNYIVCLCNAIFAVLRAITRECRKNIVRDDKQADTREIRRQKPYRGKLPNNYSEKALTAVRYNHALN